jgi:hypothetical protein
MYSTAQHWETILPSVINLRNTTKGRAMPESGAWLVRDEGFYINAWFGL